MLLVSFVDTIVAELTSSTVSRISPDKKAVIALETPDCQSWVRTKLSTHPAEIRRR